MPSPDNALQAAVYTRLVNYAPLASAIGSQKVFDHAPQGTPAPFVLIGDDTLSEWDTKSKSGWDCTLTVHAWDFERAGRKSVKNILGLIHDALHRQEANLAVAGFTLVRLEREFQQTLQEQEEGSSDHYYHGAARYRAVLHE